MRLVAVRQPLIPIRELAHRVGKHTVRCIAEAGVRIAQSACPKRTSGNSERGTRAALRKASGAVMAVDDARKASGFCLHRQAEWGAQSVERVHRCYRYGEIDDILRLEGCRSRSVGFVRSMRLADVRHLF